MQFALSVEHIAMGSESLESTKTLGDDKDDSAWVNSVMDRKKMEVNRLSEKLQELSDAIRKYDIPDQQQQQQQQQKTQQQHTNHQHNTHNQNQFQNPSSRAQSPRQGASPITSQRNSEVGSSSGGGGGRGLRDV
ncbi:hypothetical protein HDU76_002179, partial [Blyttiomyces sp. JEL0837]